MSQYDRYGRGRPSRSSLNPRGEPTRTLTASQIRQIEAAFQEAEEKAAQWEAAAAEYQRQAAQWQARAEELQDVASRAEDRMADLEARAGQRETSLAEVTERAVSAEEQAASAEGRAAEAEKALQEASEKAAEMEDRFARTQADFQNAKKRLERRFADDVDAEIMRFSRDLLPVLDNLDRAIAHAPPANPDNEALLDGLRMTQRSFLAGLAKLGVHPLDAAEQPFDPEVHEAMGTVPNPASPPGTVVDVQQKGYTYRDKLLRPARVLITPL